MDKAIKTLELLLDDIYSGSLKSDSSTVISEIEHVLKLLRGELSNGKGRE